MPEKTDAVLRREQDYLTAARAHLARMREGVLSLEAHGVDGTHTRLLAGALRRRAELLLDDPNTPLFFGRIDTAAGERWYVGRRHVADESGDPVVVDWRADVSLGFYRAGRRDPLGVDRRRRFGLDGGRITGYEDEWLNADAPAAFHSDLLQKEIERPRVGPMRDIVSTIQPEQDEIVRSAGDVTVCVQGAPGTGKTAVGLHRAAWLLYTYRERLSRSGVLVVGPNRAFLDHIGAVLPSLGEMQVRQTTVEQLTATVEVRGADPVGRAVLKGDARTAEVLRRAVWSHVGTATEPLVLPRGSRRWRLPVHTVNEIIDELRTRGVRYGAARLMLPQRLAHALLTLMEEAGEAPDDRVQDAVARSREVRRCADAVWPALVPRKVLHQLLSDAGARAVWADGLLSPAEQDRLAWEKPPRSAGSARWSVADSVLLDEIAGLLERPVNLGHVVVDEAQDLSPMQWRAVGRRCETGSATVLGDIAQGTTPWATASWPESLAHLGHAGAHVEELTRGFRVPAAVIDFAARLLPSIAPGLASPRSVRDDPGSLDLVPAAGDPWPEAGAAVRRAVEREGSIGLVVADTSTTPAADLLTHLDLTFTHLGVTAEAAEKFPTERATAERATAGRAAAGKMTAERTAAETAATETAAVGRTTAETAATGKMTAGRTAAETAATGKMTAETTATRKMTAGRTAAETTATGTTVTGRTTAVPGRPEPGDDAEEESLHALEALETTPPRITLVPAGLAKGLEFDHVIVVEPAGIAEAEPDERTGLRRLYVVLTRAVSSLTVVHTRPLPGPLNDQSPFQDQARTDDQDRSAATPSAFTSIS